MLPYRMYPAQISGIALFRLDVFRDMQEIPVIRQTLQILPMEVILRMVQMPVTDPLMSLTEVIILMDLLTSPTEAITLMDLLTSLMAAIIPMDPMMTEAKNTKNDKRDLNDKMCVIRVYFLTLYDSVG